MPLKNDSTPELVARVEAAEKLADQSFAHLELYKYPRALAMWAVLVSLVLKAEELQGQFGTRRITEALLNLSRRGTLVLRWLRDRGSPEPAGIQAYLASTELIRAVNQAMEVAGRYDGFLGVFPMWHRNKIVADMSPDGAVQFIDSSAPLDRRISAFQKGFLHPEANGGDANVSDGVTMDSCQASVRDAALSRCTAIAPNTMGYADPFDLYQILFPTYLERLDGIFRRPDTVSLGDFSMGAFRRAYAALTSVVAAHNDLCYRFGLSHGYPWNSCVMVRSLNDWVQLLAGICGLPATTVTAIIGDLTLRDRFWDMHVHPFVQLDEDALAIAPSFPLNSRADDNILRVVNHTRRAFFDRAAQQKEEEMLDDLLQRIPLSLGPCNRVPLPAGLPDIDLLLEDTGTGTLLVAELKWLQKPSAHWKERLEREADFRRGLGQLARIREFLEKSPSHLKDRGVTARRFKEYRRVAFVLVARDFFISPGSDQVLVVDHDVLKGAAAAATDLEDLIRRIEAYEWLPLEGTHFRVQRERLSLGGAAIEADVYYRV